MAKKDGKARQLAARKVRRDLAAIEPSHCHQQMQSPLFNKLPPELRNLIFALAVREEQDETRNYYYAVYKDPISKLHLSSFATKLHLDLMQTCRLVYYETESLPLQRSSIVSYYPSLEIRTAQPGSAKSSIQVRSPFRFDRLTKKNQLQLREVHMIMPSYFKNIPSILSLPQFTPRILNISLGWHDANRTMFFTIIKYNNQLEEFHIRGLEARSVASVASTVADIQAQADYSKVTRKDGRHLHLVQSSVEDFGSFEDGDLLLSSIHFVWRLRDGEDK